MNDNIISVFDVIKSAKHFGVWYCIWAYGFNLSSLWTIFVATKMIKFETKQGEVKCQH